MQKKKEEEREARRLEREKEREERQKEAEKPTFSTNLRTVSQPEMEKTNKSAAAPKAFGRPSANRSSMADVTESLMAKSRLDKIERGEVPSPKPAAKDNAGFGPKASKFGPSGGGGGSGALSRLTGKAALLSWCMQMAEGYPGVEVENFTSSFRDGLAICAILHRFYPNEIDFKKLKSENIKENVETAFELMRKKNIEVLMDVEDFLDGYDPEPFSMMTFLSQLFKNLHDQPEGPGYKP